MYKIRTIVIVLWLLIPCVVPIIRFLIMDKTKK